MTRIFHHAAFAFLVGLAAPAAAAPDPVMGAVQACTAPGDARPEESLAGFGWEELDEAGIVQMARIESEATAIRALIIMTEEQAHGLVAKLVAAVEDAPSDVSLTEDGAPLRRFAFPDTPGLLLLLVPGKVPGARECLIAIPASVNDTGFLTSLRLIPKARPTIGARTNTLTRDGADLLTSLFLPVDIPSTIREGTTTRTGPPRGIADITLFTLTPKTLSDTEPPFGTRASLGIAFTPTGD